MHYSKSDQIDSTTVYGIHPVHELILSKVRNIDHLYFDMHKTSEQLFEVIKLARKERLAYTMVPEERLDMLTYRANHQGVVAVCAVKEYADVETLTKLLEEKKGPPLLIIPASVEDPRNLGALIRTCAGLSVDAVLLERRNTAPLSGVTAKAAAGMLDYVPLVKPRNLEGLVESLKEKGFVIIGTVAGAQSLPQDVDMTGPTVVITGGENRGIPPYLAKQCTHTVGIPLTASTQSLNVSAAAAIILYECARQRRFSYAKEPQSA